MYNILPNINLYRVQQTILHLPKDALGRNIT